MKIEWLNRERTKARVIFGWLWWRRIAIVERELKGRAMQGYQDPINWHHASRGDGIVTWVSVELDRLIDSRRNWYRPGDEMPLPVAKVIQRNPVVDRGTDDPVNL